MCITVIIPTFNRAHIIEKSLKSVLNQTISPLEIIIVDDYSNDNTKEIVESFDNPTIKYVLNSKKKGANGARNTGINLAKGKFIAFQDSDDIWYADKLKKQLEFMEANEKYDMCFCSLQRIDSSKNEIVPKNKVNTGNIETKLMRSNFISTQTIFMKTEVAKEILFDENLKRFQDWDFCINISKKYRINHLNEPLVDVKIQDDSISNKEGYLRSYEQLFYKHPQLIDASFYNKSIYQKINILKNKNARKYVLIPTQLIKFISFKFVHKVFNK